MVLLVECRNFEDSLTLLTLKYIEFLEIHLVLGYYSIFCEMMILKLLVIIFMGIFRGFSTELILKIKIKLTLLNNLQKSITELIIKNKDNIMKQVGLI